MPSRLPQQRSSFIAALLMVAITLLLWFLPLVNGLIGGLVGGYYAGSVRRAILAAIMPAIVVTLGLWILFAVFDAPVVGLFAAMAAGFWVIVADLGIFLGAAAGGYASESRSPQREPA
jgi:hypothetical protein